jgi:hypothetical protein
MVNISTNINKVKNYLEVVFSFVDIGGIVDHHCLEVVFSFVDIGGNVDHHCLEVVFNFVDIDRFVQLPLNSDGQHFHQYQQS